MSDELNVQDTDPTPTPVQTNPMLDSILTSIKKMLMIDESYEHYDPDIIIHINTFLTRLCQVGIGQPGFYITDKTATWEDFLVDVPRFQQAKTYVYLRVRLLFDPPQSGAAVDAMEKNLRELEWLLFVDADPPLSETDWGGVSDDE